MKTYRSPREVLENVAALLAQSKPSFTSPSPLVKVARLLHGARNYYRVGIYLVVNDRVVRQAVCGPELPKSGVPTDHSEIAAPIRIGTQTLGYLRAEGEHSGGTGLPPLDRILLKEVALLLARYLHGNGRYLLRKAREVVREAAAAVVENPPRPPASPVKAEAPKRESLRAAAGEKVSA